MDVTPSTSAVKVAQPFGPIPKTGLPLTSLKTYSAPAPGVLVGVRPVIQLLFFRNREPSGYKKRHLKILCKCHI